MTALSWVAFQAGARAVSQPQRPARVRAVLATLGAGRSRSRPAARRQGEERPAERSPADRHRAARPAPSAARARARTLRVHERAGSTDDANAIEGSKQPAGAPRPDVVHSSLYLREPVYEALRESAFTEGCKFHDLVMEGIGLALRQRCYPPGLRSEDRQEAMIRLAQTLMGALVSRR